MIKTIYQVTIKKTDGDKVVLETEDLKEAKRRDNEIEVAGSLIVETEAFLKERKDLLPKGVRIEQLEPLIEELFLHLSENPEGFKRALKGQAFSLEEDKPTPKTKAQTKK